MSLIPPSPVILSQASRCGEPVSPIVSLLFSFAFLSIVIVPFIVFFLSRKRDEIDRVEEAMRFLIGMTISWAVVAVIALFIAAVYEVLQLK
jgi:ABC-type Fe3+-siderophore transport system permease subunit